MEEIKNLIRRASVTSAIIIIYGLIVKEKMVCIGIFPF